MLRIHDVTGHGSKLVHDCTSVLLDIKAVALTHGTLTFSRDQVGQTAHKVILLFGWSGNLRVRVRVMPRHGSSMDLQIAKCTACGKFCAKSSVEH